MRFFRALRAVLWGLLGIRRGADAARDMEGVQPGAIVLAGLLLAALVVGAIVLAVRVILGDRTGPRRTSEAVEAARVAPSSKPHGPVVVRDTIEERARPCTACHGSATQATKDGFSPRIAGKPAGYLYNQLASFRDGRRGYAPMVYLVQYMTDDYLREMAGYFARLELPYAAPESNALTAAETMRARQLIDAGDHTRGVPPCAQCHGASLSGA